VAGYVVKAKASEVDVMFLSNANVAEYSVRDNTSTFADIIVPDDIVA
jgi:hypothetical protein